MPLSNCIQISTCLARVASTYTLRKVEGRFDSFKVLKVVKSTEIPSLHTGLLTNGSPEYLAVLVLAVAANFVVALVQKDAPPLLTDPSHALHQ